MDYVYLCAAAFAAGVVNSLAGGGTLLTFPALLAVLPPTDASRVVANVTSTVALVPGSLAGAWGYRRELNSVRHWVNLLIWPSLVGGLVGALLVVVLPASYFSRLVPWLILTATVLFLVQPLLAKTLGIGKPHYEPSATGRGGLFVFQFLVAVYGSYFGAGIGILMLSALAHGFGRHQSHERRQDIARRRHQRHCGIGIRLYRQRELAIGCADGGRGRGRRLCRRSIWSAHSARSRPLDGDRDRIGIGREVLRRTVSASQGVMRPANTSPTSFLKSSRCRQCIPVLFGPKSGPIAVGGIVRHALLDRCLPSVFAS